MSKNIYKCRGNIMIDKNKFNEYLEMYKKDFTQEHWNVEKFKWEAVKWFQDKWDINAPDFKKMLSVATDKTDKLLASRMFFPKKMIEEFADTEPEFVRSMFINLYDEAKDLYDRVEKFKVDSNDLLIRCANPAWKMHYQAENSIMTYLWLKYPDKYYIYKFSDFNELCSKLEVGYTPRKGDHKNNIQKFMEVNDELCALLKADQEINEKLQNFITPSCYKDVENKILTGDFVFYINAKFSQPTPVITTSSPTSSVSKTSFLDDVYIDALELDTLKNLIRTKKNVILQGAPGVGKTFTAKRLAYSIMDEKDDERIEFIQFHQNYSYEDFIMGYKPVGDSFKLREGIFYKFCAKAKTNPEKDYFFIIDEINRGNMSKIFGELLLLIEKDYRDTEAILAYNGKPFSVPNNLYIIGMMNTADRSLAMIDYALRRRFSFFDIHPGFSSDGFKKYQETLNNGTFDELIKLIVELNKEIIEDESLGEGFCIGHSYFCGQTVCDDDWMKEVIAYDIIPMLKEYWFDNKEKVVYWEKKLLGIFND